MKTAQSLVARCLMAHFPPIPAAQSFTEERGVRCADQG